MSIRFQCSCGAPMQVKDEMAGKQGKCPKCGRTITVPARETPAAAPVFEEEGDIRAVHEASPPCPSCGTAYPPGVLVCTRCGIELATGQFVGAPPDAGPGPRVSRAPLRARVSQAAESKSFPRLLFEILLKPTEACDALGYYILNSPANIGLVMVLFFAGLVMTAAAGAFERNARAAQAGQDTVKSYDPETLPSFDTEDHTLTIEMEHGKSIPKAQISFEAALAVKRPLAAGEHFSMRFRMPEVNEKKWVVCMETGETGDTIHWVPGREGAFLQDEKNFLFAPRDVGTYKIEIEVLRLGKEGGKEVVRKSHSHVFDHEVAPPPLDVAPVFGIAVIVGIFGIAGVVFNALVIDTVARFIVGASRLLQIGIVLLFLEGVMGLVRTLQLGACLFLSWDISFVMGWIISLWGGLFLYLIAIMKTYDIPLIYAIFLAMAVFVAAKVVVFGFLLAAFIGLAGMGGV
ncbi:MAG: hypothetical protein HY720_18670 [Planctomycetes bacterium]|nr:hypothetical protein [Planctomycetota bacterium]